jgi:hypothetical protein
VNNRSRNLANIIDKYYEKLNLEKVDIEKEKIFYMKTFGKIDMICYWSPSKKKIHSVSVSFKYGDLYAGTGWVVNRRNMKIKKGQKVKLIIKDNYLIYKKIIM